MRKYIMVIGEERKYLEEKGSIGFTLVDFI